jgi:hypothetical protein
MLSAVQRRLVAQLDQRVHRLGLIRRQQAADKLGHLGLRLSAGETVGHLAIDQAEHRWDRLHPKHLRGLRVLVDVDLGQRHLVAQLADDLVEDRPERFARPAPGRPQVDDDRNLLGTCQHLGLEGGIGDVDHGDSSLCLPDGLTSI